MPDKLLTTSQAAQRLGVTPKTINDWIDRGLMPNAYKLNGFGKSPYRIPEGDVEAIEQRRRDEQQSRAVA